MIRFNWSIFSIAMLVYRRVCLLLRIPRSSKVIAVVDYKVTPRKIAGKFSGCSRSACGKPFLSKLEGWILGSYFDGSARKNFSMNSVKDASSSYPRAQAGRPSKLMKILWAKPSAPFKVHEKCQPETMPLPVNSLGLPWMNLFSKNELCRSDPCHSAPSLKYVASVGRYQSPSVQPTL